jgi:L-lactate dehydrogenase complex protein LldG
MSLSASVPCVPAGLQERITRFVAAARAVAATVECVERSAQAIGDAVAKAAPGAKRIVVAEACDIPDSLFDLCRKLPGVFSERTRRDLASADVGVTDAFAAIATTGTLCVRIDEGMIGYASLLARTHIVVVDADRIVERPSDLFRHDCLNGEGLRVNFVYITGPSATADMGPLVRGVHGPHHLHVVVLS